MMHAVTEKLPSRGVVVSALGVTQILAWGSTFYLLAVLAPAIVSETGWSLDGVIAGVSVGMLVAGLVSPRIGRVIGERGGRSVLALGAGLIAIGMVLLATTQNFAWYLMAWIFIGGGMGAGLYDAAFATLGSIYGQQSRSAIAAVTLFGGFASTVCWPVSAYLVEHLGWRGACFTYAAVHALVALPVFLLALPGRSFIVPPGSMKASGPVALEPHEILVFALLAAVVTIGAAILSMVGTLILQLLQARGMELAAAVALGMLIGPAAVGARVVEMFAGHQYHPIWTLIASAVLVAAGTLLLLFGFPVVALAIVLYAGGSGIGSIARGTVPLALFGAARYPALAGRLGRPIMIAMAASPFVGATAFRLGGADWTFALLAALALINVGLVAVLWRLSPSRNAA
ncbi:MAG: transporter [Xanthobacteraceae bacterium]|jgi:MFS family permease|nr:transporter [Xanthobacteraceae bacterium]